MPIKGSKKAEKSLFNQEKVPIEMNSVFCKGVLMKRQHTLQSKLPSKKVI